jgi:hypothetical protein
VWVESHLVKCTSCEKDVIFPFVCSYCGGKFCPEHRLPEAHGCTNIKKVSNFGIQKNKQDEPINVKFNHEVPKEPLLYPAEPQKKMKGSRIGLKLFGLAILVVLAVYFSFNLGYNIGYTTFYNKGYADGNGIGFEAGNRTGYEWGFSAGNYTGYNSGYTKGVSDGTGHGYTVRDPTYQEVLQFITTDQTDKNVYDSQTYTCANFVADVINNAFNSGYRCGYVIIDYPTSGHAIVCFNTVDRGLILIEPQYDKVVKIIVGRHYWETAGFAEPLFDDTVVRYMIVW